MLNKEGNLKQQIEEAESKANRIIREINGISSKQNVGQDLGSNPLRQVSCHLYCMGLKHGERYQIVRYKQ